MDHIHVAKRPGGKPSHGLIRLGNQVHNCLLGRSGITTRKTEGDMATPAGRYRMLFALYRKDRIGLLNCRLPMYPIDETDGWCDMPGHPNYNRWVKLPFGKSHERLKREDPLYDIIIVLDYNFSRRARNRGSAVFFHLTAERDWTAGCVAIERDLMRRLLPLLSTDTDLVIKA